MKQHLFVILPAARLSFIDSGYAPRLKHLYQSKALSETLKRLKVKKHGSCSARSQHALQQSRGRVEVCVYSDPRSTEADRTPFRLRNRRPLIGAWDTSAEEDPFHDPEGEMGDLE